MVSCLLHSDRQLRQRSMQEEFDLCQRCQHIHVQVSRWLHWTRLLHTLAEFYFRNYLG
jgi:hypothetical protein